MIWAYLAGLGTLPLLGFLGLLVFGIYDSRKQALKYETRKKRDDRSLAA